MLRERKRLDGAELGGGDDNREVGRLGVRMAGVGRIVHLDLKLDRIEHQEMPFGMRRRVRTAGAAGLATGAQGFVHDLLDGPRAASALRAAAQTAVDLARRTRRVRAAAGIADIVVGQKVTGTNDHGGITLAGLDPF